MPYLRLLAEPNYISTIIDYFRITPKQCEAGALYSSYFSFVAELETLSTVVDYLWITIKWCEVGILRAYLWLNKNLFALFWITLKSCEVIFTIIAVKSMLINEQM